MDHSLGSSWRGGGEGGGRMTFTIRSISQQPSGVAKGLFMALAIVIEGYIQHASTPSFPPSLFLALYNEGIAQQTECPLPVTRVPFLRVRINACPALVV